MNPTHYDQIVANIPGEGLRHYPGTFTRHHKGIIALNGWIGILVKLATAVM